MPRRPAPEEAEPETARPARAGLERLASTRKADPDPRAFFRVVEEVSKSENHVDLRVHWGPQKFDLMRCPAVCERCAALGAAAAGLFPREWVVYLGRVAAGAECPQLVPRATGQPLARKAAPVARKTKSGGAAPRPLFGAATPAAARMALAALVLVERDFEPMGHQASLAAELEAAPGSRKLVAWAMGSGKTAGTVYALRGHARVTVVCDTTLLDAWVDAFAGKMGIRPLHPAWDVRIRGYQRVEKDLWDDAHALRGRALAVDEAQHYKQFHGKQSGGMVSVIEASEGAAALLLLSGTALLNTGLDCLYLLRLLAPDADVTAAFAEVAAQVPGPEVGTVTAAASRALGRDAAAAVTAALRGAVHFFSPRVFQPDAYRRHYPLLREEPPIRVVMTWPQALVTFWSHSNGDMRRAEASSSVTVGGEVFSAKRAAVVEELTRRAGPGVRQVVYSALRESSLKPLQDELGLLHPTWTVELLDGRVPVPAREAIMQRYRKGRVDVLLICRVGSVGLDLPGTAVIALVDPQHNRPTESQVFARAVRFTEKAPAPAEVAALRFEAVFPGPQDPGPRGRERDAIRRWLGERKPLQLTEFGARGGAATGVDDVVRWVRARVAEQPESIDSKTNRLNAIKLVEVEALTASVHAASAYREVPATGPSKQAKVVRLSAEQARKYFMPSK